MKQDAARVRLNQRKALFLFILMAASLLLEWEMPNAEILVSEPDSASFMGLSRPDETRDLKRKTLGETMLLSQQKGVSPRKPVQEKVIINGVQLSNDRIKALEKQYGVRILPGDYWYDRMCGAWGLRGGPAAGLIFPFLDLGGPLHPNASNGNTGVFINGRELHILDVVALQQITPVYQGRYWADAQGNIGLEGGPALINLWVLADARGAKKEGILSTFDKTGVAVLGY